ncbi:MAG TPA: hypothetical protein VF119_00715 [Candidatus Limnocylindrales bacterium]
MLLILAAPSASFAMTTPLSGDGRLTATVSMDGGGPFVGIEVKVTAISDGSVMGDVLGTTDDTGSVTFDSLPVGDGSVVVEWIVEAQALETTVDPSGCELTTGWVANEIVASGLDVSLPLTVEPTWEETCPDGPPPPDGVVNDAILAVTVTDDDGPVAGASVAIFASVEDGGLIFKAGESTDEQGLVTVGGMPRPDVDGPIVTWQVRASAWTESPSPVDGCIWTRMGWGETDLEASPGTTVIEIELAWTDASAVCDPPPDGSPVLHGTVLDETGAPFAVEVGHMRQSRLDGATYTAEFTVDDSGAFEIPVHAWGTENDPSTIVIHVRGEITRTVVEGDCFSNFARMTDTAITVALADGQVLPDLEMVAWEQEVSGGCGATGTPVPGDGSEGGGPVTAPGNGPTVTLPPTDSIDGKAVAGAGGLWPAALVMALVALLAVGVAVWARR